MNKFFKVLTITLIAIVLLLILLVIADKIYGKMLKVEPGDLYLTKENTEEKIKASKGGYQWTEKSIINSINVIADSLGVLAFDYSKNLEVKPGDKIYFDNLEDWTSASASVILSKDREEIARISIETNFEEKYIIVPEIEKGKHVVQMDMEAEKGRVRYGFQINIVE